MNVEQILQSKGRSVHTVYADEPISAAISVLNTHNIGAVVVRGRNEKVTGILSERDIVRRLVSENTAILSSPVSDAMTPNPICCTAHSTTDELMQLMTDNRIRHLPVLDNDVLVGVVSIGDVVKLKISQIESETAALRDYIAT